MPLSNLLRSAPGTCRHCRRKSTVIARVHRDCQAASDAGWNEMVTIAVVAARTHVFDEKTLRLTLAGIAGRSYGDGTTVNEASEIDGRNQKRSLGTPPRGPTILLGLPRTSDTDSVTVSTASAAISALPYNTRRTAQSGTGRAESDTDSGIRAERAGIFNFAIVSSDTSPLTGLETPA